jgi:sporulation protein YlmC with PRC-barrel domain
VSEPGGPKVSWKAIEEDAEVVSADGKAVGRVAQIVGDPDADIFTGLAVDVAILGADRFVPSEGVATIWPGRVELTMTAAEIERLPDHEETPMVQWRPGRRSVFSTLRRFLGR